MKNGAISILVVMGTVILPLSYLALCFWMKRHAVWWFTYLAYFFLFGTVGGWCLTLIFPPGGILLLGSFSLMTAAVAACLASSLVLQLRKRKSIFDVVAMVGGYSYIAMLGGTALFTIYSSP
jgi:hypothetical protein